MGSAQRKPPRAPPLRRVCVLGGGGFLGSHLVRALLEGEGCEVRVLDTSLEKLELPRPSGMERLHAALGSISDAGRVAELARGCDAVVSLVALCNPSLYNTRPLDVIRSNFLDLVPIVEMCSRERLWLVHFSTCEVYGKPSLGADGAFEPMNESMSPLVLGPVRAERWTYACAKQLLERWIFAEGEHGSLPFTIVRPFNVIGARMDFLPGLDGEGIPRVLACFMDALLRQTPLPLVDGGGRRRAFIDVSDFTDAVLRILDARELCAGEILNVGNPTNDVSIAELARMMIALYADRHGGDPRLGCRPVRGEELYGPGYDDAERRIPDIARIGELLGWRPRASLAEMLPPILDDYVSRYRHRIPVGEGPPR
jgi:UDP-apiose/xylose synthase